MNNQLTLSVAVQGLVLSSNLDEFKNAMLDGISAINQQLVTDEDFGQAEADVKSLEALEKSLEAAKADVMDGAAPIRTIMEAVDKLKEHAASTRRTLGKLIETRKLQIRQEAKKTAVESLGGAVPAHISARLEAAMKGKRTVATQQAAVNKEAALIREESKAVEAFVISAGGNPTDAAAMRWKTMPEAQAEMERRASVNARLKAQAEQDAAARLKAQAEQDAAALWGESVSYPEARAIWEQRILTEQDAAARLRVAEEPAKRSAASAACTESVGKAAAEWTEFKALIMKAFMSVRDARIALAHEENKAKAQPLADAVNTAWKALP